MRFSPQCHPGEINRLPEIVANGFGQAALEGPGRLHPTTAIAAYKVLGFPCADIAEGINRAKAEGWLTEMEAQFCLQALEWES